MENRETLKAKVRNFELNCFDIDLDFTKMLSLLIMLVLH